MISFMIWCRADDKPLRKPMLTILSYMAPLEHIVLTVRDNELNELQTPLMMGFPKISIFARFGENLR